MNPLDLLGQLEAVDRTVAEAQRGATPVKVVALRQTYPVGVGDLWDACSDGSRISRWLLPVTGDLRVGGTYQLEGNAGGTVEECIPRERIAVTWEYGGDVSWVVATFSGDDETSTLHVEHTAHVDQQRWDEFGPGAVGIGWDMMVLGLAMHLGSEAARDGFEATAWTASDEGRAFMTTSGEAWRDAQLAAGDDPVTARASAERCIAAYTG